MNHESLDRRIDSVARQMTDADPAPNLQGRVIARLDERPALPWSWRWLPVTTALLAVLLVAVIVGRRPSSSSLPGAPTTPATVTSGPPPSPMIGTSGVLPEPAVGDSPRAIRTDTRSTSSDSPISDVQAAWQARALSALAQPEALTMESIQPDALAIRPLETRPLVIAPIGADEDK